MFPRNENWTEGKFGMFPRNENRNEGTFAKTTLFSKPPFCLPVKDWGEERIQLYKGASLYSNRSVALYEVSAESCIL